MSKAASDGSDVVETEEGHHLVLELLSQLPHRQRIVMARHLDGFDHAEILSN